MVVAEVMRALLLVRMLSLLTLISCMILTAGGSRPDVAWTMLGTVRVLLCGSLQVWTVWLCLILVPTVLLIDLPKFGGIRLRPKLSWLSRGLTPELAISVLRLWNIMLDSMRRFERACTRVAWCLLLTVLAIRALIGGSGLFLVVTSVTLLLCWVLMTWARILFYSSMLRLGGRFLFLGQNVEWLSMSLVLGLSMSMAVAYLCRAGLVRLSCLAHFIC